MSEGGAKEINEAVKYFSGDLTICAPAIPKV